MATYEVFLSLQMIISEVLSLRPCSTLWVTTSKGLLTHLLYSRGFLYFICQTLKVSSSCSINRSLFYRWQMAPSRGFPVHHIFQLLRTYSILYKYLWGLLILWRTPSEIFVYLIENELILILCTVNNELQDFVCTKADVFLYNANKGDKCRLYFNNFITFNSLH